MKKKYVRISYNISAKTTANAAPFNAPAIKTIPVERFEKGNDAETSLVELFNHCGTHIDMPGHKIPGAKTLSEAEIDEFIFEKPLLIDIELKDEQNLQIKDIEKYKENLSHCDILLIRSGFSKYRSTDLNRYVWKTPGVSVEATDWIIENAPNIKAIGIDFLSYETLIDTSHNSAGHKKLLSSGIKIIEDMKLDGLKGVSICRIFAFPLFIEGIDSFHATIVAETK